MIDERPMKRPKPIPGVEAREHQHGDGTTHYTYRVRWTDPTTGRRESEEFATAREALDFKAHLRLLKRRGNLADLDRGRETLAEFTQDWWTNYAAGNLERATLKAYAVTWNTHLHPRVGALQLRELTPATVARLRADLERDGIGAPTVRKALAVLQSILARAVEWGRMTDNPVRQVRKPPATRQRAVVALEPVAVERLRAVLRPEDAALVSVLAYAGLRPEEALALQWRHVRRGTLLVEAKNVDGRVLVGQKTGRPPRTIDLLGVLRQDLAEHRLATGRRGDAGLVFPAPGGGSWPDSLYRSWRRHHFQPAAATVGLATLDVNRTVVDGQRRVRRRYDGIRPYDLRHSFASLLLHEQRLSLLEVATQMGHGVAVLSSTYAHILSELKGAGPVDPDALVRDARQTKGAA